MEKKQKVAGDHDQNDNYSSSFDSVSIATEDDDRLAFTDDIDASSSSSCQSDNASETTSSEKKLSRRRSAPKNLKLRSAKNAATKKKQGKLLLWTQELKKLKTKEKPRVEFSANMKDEKGELVPPVVVRSDKTVNNNPYADPDILESDDDEGDVNRIGNVPLWWYDNMKHIGYDSTGKPLELSLDVSHISSLLRNADDPDAWKTITDVKNQKMLRLSGTDVEIIRRLKAGRFPLADYDPYGPDSIVDYDNPEEALHPTSYAYPPKRRFLPSLWENKRINQLVKLIREGKIRADPPQPPEVYDVWGESIVTDTNDKSRGLAKGPPPLSAPKMKLPGNAMSYNPPEEYLLSDKEKQQWLESHPDDREQNFIPCKYPCLRRVPSYANNLIERFQRCLDLYLCPRTVKMRMNVDPESLLPQLPSPDPLRPFPTRLGCTFESADASAASAVAFDSTGIYIAIGRRSGAVEVFDTFTTRCVLTWRRHSVNLDKDQPMAFDHSNGEDINKSSVAEPVQSVAFSPTAPILLVATGSDVYILLLRLPTILSTATDITSSDAEGLAPRSLPPSHWNFQTALELLRLQNIESASQQNIGIPWKAVLENDVKGWRIPHSSAVTSVSWHLRGLYFVSICSHAGSPSQQLAIHALSKFKSIRPFRKSPGGRIQKALFHPQKPWLFVAYQRSVRLYNLQKTDTQTPGDHRLGGVLKKFSGAAELLDVTVHPSGDHIVVGGENQRVTWFDYDLGERPYKIFRYHKGPVRTVGFHSNYPLLFSGSSDGAVHVFHAKVFPDLMNAPAIVPVKKLMPFQEFDNGKHQSVAGKTDPVLHCQWHPYQPWLAIALRNGKVGIFV